MSQNSDAAVLIQDAADEFVGKVPAMGQAAAGQRMVPTKFLLLEFAQGFVLMRAGLHEIEIALEQVVGQDRQQKVLEQSAGKRDFNVGSQQSGDLSRED